MWWLFDISKTTATTKIEEICYIDEGILIYADSSPPGPVSEGWVPTNNFVWSNKFCGWAAN